MDVKIFHELFLNCSHVNSRGALSKKMMLVVLGSNLPMHGVMNYPMAFIPVVF